MALDRIIDSGAPDMPTWAMINAGRNRKVFLYGIKIRGVVGKFPLKWDTISSVEE